MTESEVLRQELQAYTALRSRADSLYRGALGGAQGVRAMPPGPKSAVYRQEGKRLTEVIRNLEARLAVADAERDE